MNDHNGGQLDLFSNVVWETMTSPEDNTTLTVYPGNASGSLALSGPILHLAPQFTFDMYRVCVKRLHSNAMLPTKAHETDLGFDLYALQQTELPPHQTTKISTGIACALPYCYGALIRDRSSVATKQQVFVVAGVIDYEYRGEIIVAMHNPTDKSVTFEAGNKIAQMLLLPVVQQQILEVKELSATQRNTGGFGSSGK
jgi:dUTP diphosphatase